MTSESSITVSGLKESKSDVVIEDAVAPTDQLQSWAQEYEFVFVNTMHIYLRIPTSLFEIYGKQYNKQLEVMHFVLPRSLLIEDAVFPKDKAPPEPGWSRFLQGLKKEDWPHFKEWVTSSKWLARNKDGKKILYGCEAEAINVRDPVKLQTLQVVGIKEFISVNFLLPSNTAGKLFLNLKNGPPFSCTYVSRSGPGVGEASALFERMREV